MSTTVSRYSSADSRVSNVLALLVAALTVGGSLALSWGLNLRACPLCFYQRTFAMSVLAVLGVGLVTGAARGRRLSFLALPLATAGFGVALFHVSLELTGALECPPGLFGVTTAPQESLGMFALLFLLVCVDAAKPSEAGGRNLPALLGTLLLGAAMAAASCAPPSNPPMPPAPDSKEKQPTDMCHP